MDRRSVLKMFGAGAVPVRRPDQADWPRAGQGLGAGFRGNMFRGRLVIIFGTGSSSGLFAYSPRPGAGHLVASIAASAGTDPFGNAYLAGITDYNPALITAVQLLAGAVTFYSAASEAGPWTPAGSIQDGLWSEPVASGLNLQVGAVPAQIQVGSGLVTETVPLAISGASGTGLLFQVTNATGGASTDLARLAVAAAGDSWLGGRVTGDTNGRFVVDTTAGGLTRVRLGPGNATQDVVLERLAANSLGVLLADLAVDTAGRGLQVKEGSNCKQGTATLSAGSVVVANTAVTANSRIFLTMQDNAQVGTPGFLRVSARVAGTSFTVISSSGTDAGTFAYQIFEPAP